MKKLVIEEHLLNTWVLVLANGYNYHGKIVDIDDDYIKMEDPSLLEINSSRSSSTLYDFKSNLVQVNHGYIRTKLIESIWATHVDFSKDKFLDDCK